MNNNIILAITIILCLVVFASCEIKKSADQKEINIAAFESKCSQRMIKPDAHAPRIIWECK